MFMCTCLYAHSYTFDSQQGQIYRYEKYKGWLKKIIDLISIGDVSSTFPGLI